MKDEDEKIEERFKDIASLLKARAKLDAAILERSEAMVSLNLLISEDGDCLFQGASQPTFTDVEGLSEKLVGAIRSYFLDTMHISSRTH